MACVGLATAGLTWFSQSAASYQWRGAVLAGILVGNALIGVAFLAVARSLHIYAQDGGTENAPAWVIYAFVAFLFLDGAGHTVTVVAPFLPRPFAMAAIVAASVLRVLGAAASVFAALALPAGFRQMAAEPTKQELLSALDEMREAKLSVERAAIAANTELLRDAHKRIDAAIASISAIERGVDGMATAPR